MAEQRVYRIEFEDQSCTEELYATWLGGSRYRLDEAPLFSEAATIRDVIEAEVRSDGVLKFTSVVQRSAYRTWRFVLSQAVADSAALVELQQRVVSLGGEWSLVMNGYLMLHLPPGVEFDGLREVRKMMAEAHKNAESS